MTFWGLRQPHSPPPPPPPPPPRGTTPSFWVRLPSHERHFRCRHEPLNGHNSYMMGHPRSLETRHNQGCTATAKPRDDSWSRHSQRPCQGSPGILLFQLVLCITLPGVGPGKTTIAGPSHGVTLANPQGLSSPRHNALCKSCWRSAILSATLSSLRAAFQQLLM